jgi:hypothetical protein
MKNILFVIFILLQISAQAQNGSLRDNFNVPVRDEQGDLNKDGRIDKVVVTMDTADGTVPLRLQIFFAQPGGKFKLMVSSTKIIEAQYPLDKKGKHNGKQIPDFFIEDGILHMVSELTNGQADYQFKFQHGNFELIHIAQASWDGVNTTTETDFNLLTGTRITSVKSLGSEKILKESKKKVLIRPLPKIQNFKPFENELY